MSEIQFIATGNKIDKEEMEAVLPVIFNSFFISENSNAEELLENNAFIERFIVIINRFIKNHHFESKQDKLRLIRIMDKLSTQRELIDFQKGALLSADIESAGAHLGSKAQSAFND